MRMIGGSGVAGVPSGRVLGGLDGWAQISWLRQNCLVQLPQRSMGWTMDTSLHRHLQYCWYAAAEATSDQRASFVGRFMVSSRGLVVGLRCDFEGANFWVFGCYISMGAWVGSV